MQSTAMPITREMVKKAVEEAVLRAYWAMREPVDRPTEAQRPRYVIEWNEDIKAKFVEWMRANGRDERYIKECVKYLNKYMRPIRSPADVVAMFAACKGGR